jgi:hypothetical protein
MLAAPLVLARRWRGDPDWAPVSRPVQVLALVSAAALVVFASGIAGPHNGVVQRIAVTLPLTAEILIAGRMLTVPVTGSAAGPGDTPSQGTPAGQDGLASIHRPIWRASADAVSVLLPAAGA